MVGDTLKKGVAAKPVASLDSIYAKPEVAPQFVGGPAALAAFLQKTIRVPEAAMRQRIAGTVYVSFVLSEKGKVIDAHIAKGLGYGLDQAALRTVWLMPPWTPGQVGGQPVRVACTIPIAISAQ